MEFYLAPMEGVTTFLYRNMLLKYFPGADAVFTPFLAPIPDKSLKTKEIREILPEHNAGIRTVPQILSNHPKTFAATCAILKEYGYTEVNLNTGCPAGTVVSRKKGAGMLQDTIKLDRFLDTIFELVPDMKISIKTRIGVEDLSDHTEICSVLASHPFSEILIHPRTRRQFYGGIPNREIYDNWREEIREKDNRIRIGYNGNLFRSEDFEEKFFKDTDSLMAGRGVITDPSLFFRMRSKEPVSEKEIRKRLLDFHDELLIGYRELLGEDKNTLFKMREIWVYQKHLFDCSEKQLTAVKKAVTVADYRKAANEILKNCPMVEEAKRTYQYPKR